METNGFYKKTDDGILLFGPQGVYAPKFTLTNETKSDFTYPMDGWYWFDSEEEAKIFFGINKESESIDK